MNVCPNCGEKIENYYNFCPKCNMNLSNIKQKNVNQKKKHPVLRLILGIFLFFVGLTILLSYIIEDSELPDDSNIEYIQLDANQLHRDYNANEINAKDMYENKYYIFEGEILEIDEFLNDKSATFKYNFADNNMELIYFYAHFNGNTKEIKELNTGDYVSLKCQFEKRSIEKYLNISTSYSFRNCRINR